MSNNKPHYGDYLQLTKVLTAQTPLSEPSAKDEMLFIIVHQAHELWFKQILLELDSLLLMLSGSHLDDSKLLTLSRTLHRIHIIQGIVVEQLSALSTLSPMEFLEFREALTPASGFQSVQFRLIEIKLGVQKKQLTHALTQDEINLISIAEKDHTLVEAINLWLERMPFLTGNNFTFWQAYRKQVALMFEKDRINLNANLLLSPKEKNIRLTHIDELHALFISFFTKESYQHFIATKKRRMSFKASQAALFIFLYRDNPVLQLPYQILSQLIQIDENLRTWKSKHLLLVQRIIGGKMGTGGSAGTSFLAKNINNGLFDDLTSLSTFMLPHSLLPQLPDDIKKGLNPLNE